MKINVLGLTKSIENYKLIGLKTCVNEININDSIMITQKDNTYNEKSKIEYINKYESKLVCNNVNENKTVNNFTYIYDSNVEIVLFKVNDLNKNNINIDIISYEDEDIIFYNFLQNITIGLNINSQFETIEKDIYISDTFKNKKNIDFEIKPINVQVRLMKNILKTSIYYALVTEKNNTKLNRNKNLNSSDSKQYLGSDDFYNFNYIDINKEFI